MTPDIDISLTSQSFSRREALKNGIAVGAVFFTNTEVNASAAEYALDQEVPTDVEDVSTLYINLPNIDASPELNTDAAPDLRIEDVNLNPNIKPKIYRQNRIGRAIFATLARADALVQNYIDPIDPNTSKLIGLLSRSGEFPEPNLADFINRLEQADKNNEPLWLPIMAYTQDSPTERVWTKIDMRKGININFVATPEGGIWSQVANDNSPIDTYKFRMDNTDEGPGQLTMDIYYNNVYRREGSSLSPQEIYDQNLTDAVRRGFSIFASSVGASDSDRTDVYDYVQTNYPNQVLYGELFPELFKLLIGEKDENGTFSNLILRTKLAGK